MVIKANPGLVPGTDETNFQHTYQGQLFTFYLTPKVARPTIHSFLLAENLAAKAGETLLDVGSGTGFVGIMAATCYGVQHSLCSDVNVEAVETIRRNAETNGVADKITAVQSDLFGAMVGMTFDVIVSNPPQSPIPPEMDETERQRSQDQYISTFSTADGLGHVRLIIREAPTYLRPGGRLQLVLHEYLGLEKVIQIMQEHGFVTQKTATDKAAMSPTTQKLRTYIETQLGYRFPTLEDGTAYTLVSVLTGVYSG